MNPIPLVDAAPLGAVVAELSVEGPELSRFRWGAADRPRAGLLLRRPEGPVAFEDLCPHWAVPLTHLHPNVVSDGQLTCSVHRATFDATGLCIAGPCEGSRLTPLAVRIEGDTVHVHAPTLVRGLGVGSATGCAPADIGGDDTDEDRP